jgi:hypothetical protein
MEPTLTISLKQVVELDKLVNSYRNDLIKSIIKKVSSRNFINELDRFACSSCDLRGGAKPDQYQVEIFAERLLQDVIPERESLIKLLVK